MDNGPELTATAMRDWCRFSNVATAFIEPGSPWQNGYSESFNGRVALFGGEELVAEPCSGLSRLLDAFATGVAARASACWPITEGSR
ncbi:MAG: integrase core domain-containing protein [Actinomycetota bacterium]|nr:integrase core domain-containing protein [Actinomycetota bacterium]